MIGTVIWVSVSGRAPAVLALVGDAVVGRVFLYTRTQWRGRLSGRPTGFAAGSSLGQAKATLIGRLNRAGLVSGPAPGNVKENSLGER